MKVLICICSKYPNSNLYNCINNLYNIQINTNFIQPFEYEIHIVDSNSDNLCYYDEIINNFPNVIIHFIKNEHYEYGAWKYILNNNPNNNIYFCIQDTININKYIDLNVINNNTVYTFHHCSGYYSHTDIKELALEKLKNTPLDYMHLIDYPFNLAQHNSFIISKDVLTNIFNTLTSYPINKIESCIYERTFGIYFINNQINTYNLYVYMTKMSGGRN